MNIPDWCYPRRRSRWERLLALLPLLLALLPWERTPEPPPEPTPLPASAPAPAAKMLCVMEEGRPVMRAAPAEGDGRVADVHAWYARRLPIQFEGREWVPWGTRAELSPLHLWRRGELGGVPVFSQGSPIEIYLPLEDCTYQPYRARSTLQTRG